ncbi:hypothetical protein C496_18283 [Natronorubrum tibetense GA33]|uniref:Uncharacterized protein n=1 Tax=Natronorubrum tibetense GA33 TaxID=1114856 RepID=L9VM34_9EURY|nr:hypothetical protein C496_18283 [Natronorubrum tibetense GA33]
MDFHRRHARGVTGRLRYRVGSRPDDTRRPSTAIRTDSQAVLGDGVDSSSTVNSSAERGENRNVLQREQVRRTKQRRSKDV